MIYLGKYDDSFELITAHSRNMILKRPFQQYKLINRDVKVFHFYRVLLGTLHLFFASLREYIKEAAFARSQFLTYLSIFITKIDCYKKFFILKRVICLAVIHLVLPYYILRRREIASLREYKKEEAAFTKPMDHFLQTFVSRLVVGVEV